jgi:hypothetical protein
MASTEGRNDDGGDTTITRRTVLGAAGLLAGLAGCSGGGDGGDDGGDGSSPTEEPEPTDTETQAPMDTPEGGDTATEQSTTAASSGPTVESMCQVAETDLEELSVVGCQSSAEDGNLLVDVTIRNDGQQETDLFEYDLEVTPYDATEVDSANNIGGGGQSNTYPGDTVAQPGETRSVTAVVALADSASPSDVQLYTVAVQCGTFSEGLYCQ